MRTSFVARRWFSVLIAILLWIIVLPDSYLMADKPSFSISNSFQREQTYIPGDWDIVDSYSQDYSLGWSEVYSSRLMVDLTFNVKLEDNIRSLDIDDKTVTLSTDGSLTSLIWDLGFDLGDTITYTNEFNNPRSDEIEYGVDLNFNPFLLPPLKVKLQRLWDVQDQLEDKTDEKLEVNTEYQIGNSFDFNLAWQETQVDDRISDNADSDGQEWKTDFTYSKALLPLVKVDFKTNYSGSRDETLNNAGVVLNTDKAKNLEQNLKMTVDAFPNVSSSFEIVSGEEFVLGEKDLGLNFSASSDQQLVSLGTLTEQIDVSRNKLSSDLADSQENTTDLSLELAGGPWKYADYSIKYAINLSENIDNIDPANDTDSRSDIIDISLTLDPNEKITIDSSYNRSAERQGGSRTGTEETFKLEGTFSGEVFNIPNLVFTPDVTVSEENNLADGTKSESLDLTLDLVYAPDLPSTVSWDITTTYKWSKADSVQSTLDLKSDFTMKIPNLVWDLQFKESSSTTFDLENNEPNSWQHDLDFTIGSDLTNTIVLDANYNYKYDDEGQDTDELEINMDWSFLSSSLSFSFSQGRTFEGPKNLGRTYSAEFSMDF